jgi:hypothetical protein
LFELGSSTCASGIGTADDDRDLLIIEEDVPASVRHASVAAAAPTLSGVSYPQLFQQLRG